MTIEPYRRAWAALPSPYRLAAVVAAGVLLVLVATGIGGAVSHWKDGRFDAAEQKRAEERTALAAERDAAIRRAEDAETRAALLEDQATALRAVAEDKGATARQQAEAAKEIGDAIPTVVERAGADPATARDEYREALRRLGYWPPKR